MSLWRLKTGFAVTVGVMNDILMLVLNTIKNYAENLSYLTQRDSSVWPSSVLNIVDFI